MSNRFIAGAPSPFNRPKHSFCSSCVTLPERWESSAYYVQIPSLASCTKSRIPRATGRGPRKRGCYNFAAGSLPPPYKTTGALSPYPWVVDSVSVLGSRRYTRLSQTIRSHGASCNSREQAGCECEFAPCQSAGHPQGQRATVAEMRRHTWPNRATMHLPTSSTTFSSREELAFCCDVFFAQANSGDFLLDRRRTSTTMYCTACCCRPALQGIDVPGSVVASPL